VTAYFAPRDEADAKPAMARGFVDDVQLKPRCLSAEAFFVHRPDERFGNELSAGRRRSGAHQIRPSRPRPRDARYLGANCRSIAAIRARDFLATAAR
jgi:hypothetical protein